MNQECQKWPMKSNDSIEKEKKWTEWANKMNPSEEKSTNLTKDSTTMNTKWR